MTRDRNHPDYLEDCIGCQSPLFINDLGYRYDDGPMACKSCAPTWDQAKENWEAQRADDPDGYAKFMREYEDHVARGGQSCNLIVHPL